VWDRAAKQNDSGFPAARRFPAYVEHENVRLFRRDPAILFVGRVHESVGPRIVELGRQLAPAGFVIHHFGLAADAEVRERKNRLYRELGQQKIREMPRDAQAHLELGLVELDNFDNPAGALQLFQRACELNRKLGVAWFFAGVTQCRLNLHQQAVVSLKQAERLGHATPLVAETMGDAHYNLGEFSHACHCYERALRRSPGDASVESKLGLAEVRSGQVDRGLRRLLQAIEHQPTSSELHDRLIMAQVWLGQLEEAAKTAEVKLAVVEPSAADFLRAASIWARLQAMPRAENLLRAGLTRFPEVEALRSGLEEVQRQGASICQPDAPV
jgi:tetratricopeptide (TPR) repeat protein